MKMKLLGVRIASDVIEALLSRVKAEKEKRRTSISEVVEEILKKELKIK